MEDFLAYVQSNLRKWGIPNSVFIKLNSLYSESHRYYHNWEHIEDVVNRLKIDYRNVTGEQNTILYLSAIFHDAYYDPRASDNEEKSADFFKDHFNNGLGVNYISARVVDIINDTKHHSASSNLSAIFCEADMASALDQSLSGLIQYEEQIFKEFQFVDYKTYKQKRLLLLSNFASNYPQFKNLPQLIDYVSERKPRIGVYAGSFNPFHKGHLNVLEKAEKMFDKVIIARGKNPDKSANEVVDLPESIQFRQVDSYEGLLTDYLQGLGYEVTLVRGLRDSTDLLHEATQTRYLQDLMPDINVVYIMCDHDYVHISSSAIRTLAKYNKDSGYLI